MKLFQVLVNYFYFLSDCHTKIKDDLLQLGGMITINSKPNHLTNTMIVIDQVIYQESSMKLEKIDKEVNGTKILIVSDDDKNVNEIKKVLKEYSVNLIIEAMGINCLKRVRDYEKFDLIILKDDLDKLTGLEIYNKLKEIPGFSIDVIMMTKLKDFRVKEMYLKLGIKDIASLPIDKKVFKEIVCKYIKE